MKCKKCIYFKRDVANPKSTMGFCHKHLQKEDDKGNRPIVYRNDFCGEFQNRKHTDPVIQLIPNQGMLIALTQSGNIYYQKSNEETWSEIPYYPDEFEDEK